MSFLIKFLRFSFVKKKYQKKTHPEVFPDFSVFFPLFSLFMIHTCTLYQIEMKRVSQKTGAGGKKLQISLVHQSFKYRCFIRAKNIIGSSKLHHQFAQWKNNQQHNFFNSHTFPAFQLLFEGKNWGQNVYIVFRYKQLLTTLSPQTTPRCLLHCATPMFDKSANIYQKSLKTFHRIKMISTAFLA